MIAISNRPSLNLGQVILNQMNEVHPTPSHKKVRISTMAIRKGIDYLPANETWVKT